MAERQYPYVKKLVVDGVDIVDNDDHNKQEEQLFALTNDTGGRWDDDPNRPTPTADAPYPFGYNETRKDFEFWDGTAWRILELTYEKGQANGYASLDGTAKVPLAQLPSTNPLAHASTHEGGSDPVSPAGIGADTPAQRDTAISTHAGITGVHHTRPVDNELLPAAHVSSHQDGGGDDLNVDNLAGLLASPQTAIPHKTDHESGGGDELSLTGMSGLLATPQTPIVHKDTHKTGGTDAFQATDIIEAIIKRIRETGGPTTLNIGSIPDDKFLKRSGTNLIGTDVTTVRVLSWQSFPSVNGAVDHLGWYRQTDASAALASGAPVLASVAGFHSRWAINVTGAVGLPFTIRITGRSIDRDTGVETPADTEDIAVAANGYYQSTKWWLDGATISIVEGAKSCTIDVWRITYWENGDINFTVKGYVLKWTPSNPTWAITFSMYKINDDGSRTSIDSVTYTNGDPVPRAANGEPGSHKRGGFSTLIQPSTLKEGLQIDVSTTNLKDYYAEVCYE